MLPNPPPVFETENVRCKPRPREAMDENNSGRYSGNQPKKSVATKPCAKTIGRNEAQRRGAEEHRQGQHGCAETDQGIGALLPQPGGDLPLE